MPSLYTEIVIHAPRSQVWQALVQKSDWLRWNTYLYDRDPYRDFRPGQKLMLSSRRVAGDEENDFESSVMVVQPNVCLGWTARAFGFNSEQMFELQDVGVNLTKYTHRATLTGALVPMLLPFIRQDEQRGMRRMAVELKQYVERSPQPRESVW